MQSSFLSVFLRRRLLLHCLFWVIFAFFYSLGLWFSPQSFYIIVLDFSVVMLSYAVYVYVCLYFIYGFLITKKRYILALIVFLGILFAATSIQAFTFNIINSGDRVIFFNFVPFFIFLFSMALAMKIARNLYLSLLEELSIKNDLLAQKEYFLRSQIHPHFLFNTLSNFYGLALEQAKELPDFMLKLSNILRHQIYHSEEKQISLESEISYLQDYIALEKIRFSNNLFFNFEFPKSIPIGISVLPSVFIVFFENAFKHSKDVAGKAIRIDGFLRITTNQIHFHLQNSRAEKRNETDKTQGGLGLENVKKRLLLNYHSAHELIIKEEADSFLVDLWIR